MNDANKKKGVQFLFNEKELKTFFKKYLISIGVLELFIFLVCWVYKIGGSGADRFGPVSVPFPWKTYFLISFLAPIVITFMLGIFIAAFNKYFYGEKNEKVEVDTSAEKAGYAQKFQTFLNTLLQIPFLMTLVLLAIGAGLIYKINDIVGFLSSAGAKSLDFLTLILSIAMGVGSVLGLIWMILNYKLRKKDLEYQYKTEVMNRLGLVFTEDNTLVDRSGKPVAALPEQKDQVPRLVNMSEENSETESSVRKHSAKY